MESTGGTTHSFIVRVWLEPRERLGARSPWRGVIEHVASGQRRYLKHPREISEFVLPFTGALPEVGGEGLGEASETPH